MRPRNHSCEILPINEGPGIIKPMRMKMKARKINKNKQPSKTQLYTNNKLTNYMFRPSKGHLPTDVFKHQPEDDP